MIDLSNQTISLLGKTEPIKQWQVWFVTPDGLREQPQPDSMPVPVALADTIFEPYLFQGVVDEETISDSGQAHSY